MVQQIYEELLKLKFLIEKKNKSPTGRFDVWILQELENILIPNSQFIYFFNKTKINPKQKKMLNKTIKLWQRNKLKL